MVCADELAAEIAAVEDAIEGHGDREVELLRECLVAGIERYALPP